MSKITVNLRHRIVKLIAPKLFEDWSIRCGVDSIDFYRPMVSFLKDQFGNKPLVGCEVGVREGINALRILKTLNIKRLYLIDPYMPYYEPLIPGTLTLQYHEKMKAEAYKKLKDYKDRVVWVHQSSNQAFTSIKDDLDFCYLDGNHSFAEVCGDIENFGKLIVKDGVLGGHDFTQAYFGLCQAVLDAEKSGTWNKLSGAVYDWWLIKK